MKLIDLTGQRFGRLVVLERVENAKDKHSQWLCKCDCGNTKVVRGNSLRRGEIVSCGCYAREQRLLSLTKHGLAHTKLNNRYDKMLSRCYNPKDKSYANYGGRGIKVCDEWLNDSRTFYFWAIEHGYDEDANYMQCTLDRIDVNGDYSPENCRFVDIKTQCNNRTSNRLITYNAETHNLVGWEEKTGIKRATIAHRLKLGWTVEETLTRPLCKNQYDRQQRLK